MYYLKLFNEDLISFDMENNFGLSIKNINVLSNNKDIFPVKLKDKVNAETIEEFIKSRIVPKNRTFVQTILESAGLNINDKKGVIDVSKGLSLTDSYWIIQDNSLKFEDYNLYENDFSEVLSLVAFTGYSSKIKELITSPEFTTNGMLPKAWRKIDKQIYLYKGGTETYHFANTGFEPYSEFYSSQVARKMDIFHIEYDLIKWKGILSSTCKIFTNKDTSYVQIGDVITYGGIKKVYEYIKSLGFEDKFSDMILFDAICINTDRHFGNFGLLRDNHSGNYTDFAPIFDNGESLLSKTMPDIFIDKSKFKEYIQREEVNISYYGVSYDELVLEFCNKSHIKKLRKLLDFKFEKHHSYNLSDERIDCLNFMINERAKRFIDILNIK